MQLTYKLKNMIEVILQRAGINVAFVCMFSLLTLASSAAAANEKEDPCGWEKSNLANLVHRSELFNKADSISDAEVRDWSKWAVFKRSKDDERRCPGNAEGTNSVAFAALKSRQKDVGPYLKRACSFGLRDPYSIDWPDTDVIRQASEKEIREGATKAMERMALSVQTCGKLLVIDPDEGLD